MIWVKDGRLRFLYHLFPVLSLRSTAARAGSEPLLVGSRLPETDSVSEKAKRCSTRRFEGAALSNLIGGPAVVLRQARDRVHPST